jgi:ArsR family transcriptional regulator
MFDPQDFYSALADDTRRRLLALLQKQGELCVCELGAALDMAQPKVSRHLAVMREAAMLAQRREGTWMFYRLDPHLPLWAARTLEAMLDGMPDEVLRADAARLSAMAGRPERCLA